MSYPLPLYLNKERVKILEELGLKTPAQQREHIYKLIDGGEKK